MHRLLRLLLLVVALLVITSIYLVIKEDGQKNHLTLYGNVDVRQVDLAFRVLGRVDAMPFQEGDKVRAGMLVASLDKQPFLDEVAEREANLLSALYTYENQEAILARRQAIVGQGAVAEEDYETAKATKDIAKADVARAEASLGVAKTNLVDTECYAPADGIILTRIREPGTIAKVGDPVYTLTLLSPVWIRAFVSEPELGRIYPGMKAEVYTDSGGVYEGHIGFISPVAEFTPKTVETTQLRTDLVYRLRVIADNPDEGLRQGMPVTVKLKP